MKGNSYGLKPPKREIKGSHNWTKSWIFDSQFAANLADSMANEGSKNGVEVNEFRYIFTMTLRMLKSNDGWAK